MGTTLRDRFVVRVASLAFGRDKFIGYISFLIISLPVTGLAAKDNGGSFPLSAALALAAGARRNAANGCRIHYTASYLFVNTGRANTGYFPLPPGGNICLFFAI